MKIFSRAYPVMLILVLMVALSACGPTSKKINDYSMPGNLSGLELDKSQAPTLLYKRPGVPTLAAYNRFIIDPVKVDYTDPKMKELDPEQVGEMQQYFHKAMIKELRDGGYEVGTRSQAGTMRISLRISNLKTPSALPNVSIVAAPIALSVGEVTVEAIFRHAVTNRIDWVVVDRSKGSYLMNPTPWSTMSDVKATFDKWAKGVREAIDKAHGR